MAMMVSNAWSIATVATVNPWDALGSDRVK